MSFVDWVGVGAVIIPAIVAGYKLFNKLNKIIASQERLEMDTLRLQLLQMIQHDPTNRIAITMLKDIYVKRNGNSYILTEYEKWAKKYNKPTKAKK